MERRLVVPSRDPPLPLEGTVFARLLLLSSLLVLLLVPDARARIVRVPADTPFREALWYAETGDTILVAPGRHYASGADAWHVDLVIRRA